MNLAFNASVVVALIYYLVDKYLIKIPNTIAVFAVMIIAGVTCFITAFYYDYTIADKSIVLYIASFISGTVGNLTYQVLYIFLIKYELNYLIAARTGSDFITVVVSVISIVQNPGSLHHVTFSPRIYFLAMGTYFLLIPTVSLSIILYYNIGLDESNQIEITDIEGENEIVKLVDDFPGSPHKENDDSSTNQRNDFVRIYNIEAGVASCKASSLTYDHILLIAAVVWVDFNTWGLITTFIPFALANTSTVKEQSVNLAYALQFSNVALVLGDLSFYVYQMPLWINVILFTGLIDMYIFFSIMYIICILKPILLPI
jgi:hypothetical protein